jgi:hypothetical protein
MYSAGLAFPGTQMAMSAPGTKRTNLIADAMSANDPKGTSVAWLRVYIVGQDDNWHPDEPRA